MAVVLDLPVGDAISLDGGRIIVTVREKSGRRVKLSIEADDAVKVERVQHPPNVAALAAKGLAPRG